MVGGTNQMTLELFAQIFGALALVIGGLYAAGSKLIGLYFDAKQENENIQMSGLNEKIGRLESAIDQLHKKIIALRETSASLVDSRFKELISEIQLIAKDYREALIQLARLQEKMEASTKIVSESNNDAKTFMTAVLKRFAHLESEQIKIGQELIMIKERKHGR